LTIKPCVLWSRRGIRSRCPVQHEISPGAAVSRLLARLHGDAYKAEHLLVTLLGNTKIRILAKRRPEYKVIFLVEFVSPLPVLRSQPLALPVANARLHLDYH
jgi:hypothetical protein